MSQRLWGILKWIATGCFLLAALSMISAHAAALSYTPWILFVFGNTIWLIDSYKTSDWSWLVISLFFVCLDMLVFCSRLGYPELLSFLNPITSLMENLP